MTEVDNKRVEAACVMEGWLSILGPAQGFEGVASSAGSGVCPCK
jgi:hypothetical protein